MKVVDSKNIDTVKVGDLFIMKCPRTGIVYVMKFKKCTCECGNYMVGTRPHKNSSGNNESMLVHPSDGGSIVPKRNLIRAIKNNSFGIHKYTTNNTYLTW